MKKILFGSFLGLAFASAAFASEERSVFNDEKNPPLSTHEICSRLELQAEAYVLDDSGKRLGRKMATSQRQRYVANPFAPKNAKGVTCTLQSGWASQSSEFSGDLVIKYKWQVRDDGTMSLDIEQYKGFERNNGGGGGDYIDKLKAATFEIVDFAPVTWVSLAHKKERVVVRFTPILREDDKPKDLTEVPLSGEDVTISDNQGGLWTKNLTADGKYLGVVTQKGFLALSYYPFNGAKELGVARENTIELLLGKNRIVTLQSKSNFVPAGVNAKIYGMYDDERRSRDAHSTHVFTSNKEEDFLKSVNRD